MSALVHQVVQLHPTHCRNPMFAGCLMVITEVKDWGVQGYVQALGENGQPGGQAYYRAQWQELEPLNDVGRVPWIVGEADDTGDAAC